jgi:glucose uptake protein
MIVVESYAVAVTLCIVTMMCWGSWANTQKLTGKDWPFQLFYWDYAIGVVLLALLMALPRAARAPLDEVFSRISHRPTRVG